MRRCSETDAAFTADKTALDKVVGGFAISDTAANVQAALASLAADTHITKITATGGTLTETVAGFTCRQGGARQGRRRLAISDTAGNVQAALASLAADTHITVIAATGGTLTETAAAFSAYQAALDKAAGGFAVSDTATNVQADLSSLAADTHVTSITATGGTLTETVAEFTADKAALDKVVGGFAISDTGANVQGALASLAADTPHHNDHRDGRHADRDGSDFHRR